MDFVFKKTKVADTVWKERAALFCLSLFEAEVQRQKFRHEVFWVKNYLIKFEPSPNKSFIRRKGKKNNTFKEVLKACDF